MKHYRKIVVLWIVMVVGLTLSCKKEVAKKISNKPESLPIEDIENPEKYRQKDSNIPEPSEFIAYEAPQVHKYIDPEKEASKIANEVGAEGNVTVEALVSVRGTVIKTKIRKSSGNEILDKEAIRIVKKMNFMRAKAIKKPTSIWISYPIKFRFDKVESYEHK